MPDLAVFFSIDKGFNHFYRIGVLSREVAIYERFAAAGWNVSFYTYDRVRKVPEIGFEASVHSQWPFIIPRQLNFLYHALLPFRFFRAGRKVDIIITSQAHSSGPAIRAGNLWNAKVVARCGYVFGEAAETLRLSGTAVRKKISEEKYTLNHAEVCIVPTKELKTWVCTNYQLPEQKILILPNYVDTIRFSPTDRTSPEFDLIAVGRLVPSKRHHLLLETFAGTDTKIHIIGNGVMGKALRVLAKETQSQVRFTPRVQHDLLSLHMNNAKIYVNLSRWEGHPKSLIEAMACGRACIGVRSPGIDNLIIDGETGILVDPEPQKIRDVVENVLLDQDLRNRLGKNARQYVVEHFSLDVIFPKYKEVFEQLLELGKSAKHEGF